jgi:hypothetical protein
MQDQSPAVIGTDLRRLRRHQFLAVRNDVKHLAVPHVARVLRQQRWGRLEATLDRDSVSMPVIAVARLAENLE